MQFNIHDGISYRIIGSNFDQELIGIFPPATVTLNGFGVERYLEYTVCFHTLFYRCVQWLLILLM